jgi:allantoicase
VDIDTLWFTGNYVEHAEVHACCAPVDALWFDLARMEWTKIVDKTKLVAGTADLGHNLVPTLGSSKQQRFTHIKLTIYPDGGVSRLRVYGRAQPDWKQVSPVLLQKWVKLTFEGNS